LHRQRRRAGGGRERRRRPPARRRVGRSEGRKQVGYGEGGEAGQFQISRFPNTTEPRLKTPAIEAAPILIKSMASPAMRTASISLPGSRLPTVAWRSRE